MVWRDEAFDQGRRYEEARPTGSELGQRGIIFCRWPVFFNDLLHVEHMPVILSMLKHGSWNYVTMFFFKHFWMWNFLFVSFVLHSPPWEFVKMWQVYHAYDGRGRQSLVSDYHRFAKNGSILQVKNGGVSSNATAFEMTKRVSLESLKEEDPDACDWDGCNYIHRFTFMIHEASFIIRSNHCRERMRQTYLIIYLQYLRNIMRCPCNDYPGLQRDSWQFLGTLIDSRQRS